MAAGINVSGNSKAIKAQERADADWNAYYPQLKAEFAKYGITIDPSIRLIYDYGNLKLKDGGASYLRTEYDKDPVTKKKIYKGNAITPPNVFAENFMNKEYREAWTKRALTRLTDLYVSEYYDYSNPNEALANRSKGWLDQAIREASAFGMSPDDINQTVQAEAARNKAEYDAKPKGGGGDWFDSVFDVAMNVGLAVATGGLSIPEQIAFNAAWSLANGASIEDVLKNSLATLAGSEIPGFLDKIGATVTDPNIQAVIDNVAKQATVAAIKGQDIRAAALGGLAGGAVSQGISTSGQEFSYNAQIAKAAGEYVQAKTAGLSEEQALTRALTGFISQSEKEKAREQILQRAEAGTYTDPNKPMPQPGTSEFQDMQEKSLPTVEVVDRFQPTSADKLSLLDQGKQAQVGEKGKSKDLDPRYRILLSILNQPSGTSQFTGGTSGGKASSVATTGQGASPGSSALAQALRTDSGDTITGNKGGRRAGWNIESLRYMGNSGGGYDKETS